MTKKRNIHIKDIWSYSVNHHWSDGKFELTIEAEKKNVIFHLERFDVQWIAEKLWEVVNAEQKQVDDLKKALQDC